ncbi:MAG: hypothetical protein ACI4F7_10600, partial [Acutalibacteraceae bacterium]
MADNNDGSIIIDTELDNEGFEKGSDKLLSAIKDLGNAVDNLGDNMMNSFGKITPLLSSIASSAAAVNAKLENSATQAAQVNEQVVNTERQITDAAQQAAQAVEQQANAEQHTATTVQQTTAAVQQQTSGILELSNQTETATTSMSALEKEVSSLSTSMQSISSSAEMGFANGKAVLTFDSKLSEMENKIAEARTKLEEFGNTKIPTEDYIWIQDAIQKTETQLDKLIDRQSKMQALGVKESSQSWKQLTYDISLTEQMLQTYKQDLAALENSDKAFVMGSNTSQYAQMEQSLARTTETLNRNKALIDQEALAQARLNVQVAQEALLNARTSAERQKALSELQAALSHLRGLADSMATPSSQPQPPARSTVNGWAAFGAVLRQVGSAAVRVVGSLGRMAFNTLANGIKSATTRLKGFARQATQTNAITSKMAKTLTGLKRLLIARVKNMLISSIMESIKTGIQALAKFSAAFDDAISNIKNRSKEIGANFAVSLSGVIQSLEPLITAILDAISRAITYFNAFLAMLGGKSTVTVAKKQTDSYAKSLDKASDSAEELKQQVYGFDELNKRSSNKSSGSGASDNLFEEVPIESILPDSIKTIFDKLKDDIQNKNWADIGLTIASGINNAIKAIDDWINNALRPKGVEWAENIASILNGLTAGVDWGALGATLADGFNAVFDIANTFLSNYDFFALGSGLGNAIMSWIKGIDWALVGETFANAWNALINFIYGIVSEFDGATVGEKLALFVNSFSEKLNLENAAKMVSKGLNEIGYAINSFLKNTDFDKIGADIGKSIQSIFDSVDFETAGENIGLGINSIITLITEIDKQINFGNAGMKLAAGVNTAFSTIKWSEMGSMLINGFNDAVAFLSEFIGNINWQNVGAGIMTSIKTALIGDGEGNGGIDWAELGQLLYNTLDGAIRFAFGLLTSVDWAETIQGLLGGIGEALANADLAGILVDLTGLLASVVAEIPSILAGLIGGIADLLAGLFKSIGWDGIAGFFEGIGDALANVGNWLKENVVDPVVNSVKQLFGIHSPSTVFEEIGDFVIQGLFNGISDAWKSITEFFDSAISGLCDFFETGWETITTGVSDAWNGITKTVSETWDSISKTVSDGVESFAKNWETGWNNITDFAKDTWDSISKTASDTWNSISKGVSDGVKGFAKNWETGWNNITKFAKDTWDN